MDADAPVDESASPVEVEGRRQREYIQLTRSRLWAILFTVWVMSVVSAAGVGWVFAGISSDRSNDALKQVLTLQRTQGNEGLSILYKSASKRCLTARGTRQIEIHNARIQAKHELGVTIPPPPAKCATTVKNPLPKPPHGTDGP